MLAVLLLLTSALLTVEAIAGARRSRELREELEREHGIKFAPYNPNMSERAGWPVKKSKLQDAGPELAHRTPSERIALVWQATLQGWALFSRSSDEPSFRRDVARVIRGRG